MKLTVPIFMICCVFVISDTRDHDEPHITEEIFFSHHCMWHIDINVKVLEEPLMKHGVLDEASLHVLHGLMYERWPFMDVMHYVMYRLGKRENGLQIFYHCLREIQYIDSSFRRIVRELEREGLLLAVIRNNTHTLLITDHLL